MTFTEQLIEKLKTGPVWCWTRGGGLIEVLEYDSELNKPFLSSVNSWNPNGNYLQQGETIFDLIAICTAPEVIRKQFEQDTQRQPVAKDFVVWTGSDGYLKNGELLQVESVTGAGMLLANKINYRWPWSSTFRFATPEEIAATEKPEFKVGDVVVHNRLGVISTVKEHEIKNIDLWQDEHRHATPEEKAKFYAKNQPAFKDGVYLDNGVYVAIKKVANGFEYYYPINRDTELFKDHIKSYKYICPLPPEGYRLEVLHKEDSKICDHCYYLSLNGSLEWKKDIGSIGRASGIEKGYLYAFPIEQPKPVVPSIREAVTTVNVWGGAE